MNIVVTPSIVGNFIAIGEGATLDSIKHPVCIVPYSLEFNELGVRCCVGEGKYAKGEGGN